MIQFLFNLGQLHLLPLNESLLKFKELTKVATTVTVDLGCEGAFSIFLCWFDLTTAAVLMFLVLFAATLWH